ncbi:MAG TPA: DUF1887 family CARF protein [bacterium]|nr:DUF1887 family CARF protein [bacterium]
MARILVSLISDQVIPNLFVIKELEGIDKHLIISTEYMERSAKSKWLINAANLPERHIIGPVIVQEDSLVDIGEKLGNLEFEDNDEFLVNLTGGTKIMAIGVHDFFRNRQSQIFYVPIRKNLYRKIFPQVKVKETDISYRVNLREYLTSYGIRATLDSEYTPQTTYEEAVSLLNFFQGSKDAFISVVNSLRKYRNKGFRLSDDPELWEQTKRLPIAPTADSTFSKYQIQLLTGTWFEELIYHAIRKQLRLSSEYIQANLKIEREITGEKKSPSNEFDVMFTYGNVIHVVECKTGVYDNFSQKSIVNDTLYKLAALRPDFGLAARNILVTLALPGETNQNIKPIHYTRADTMNTKIIDGSFFQDGFDPSRLVELILQSK